MRIVHLHWAFIQFSALDYLTPQDYAWDSNYWGLDVLWVTSFRKVNKKSKSKQYFRLVKIEKVAEEWKPTDELIEIIFESILINFMEWWDGNYFQNYFLLKRRLLPSKYVFLQALRNIYLRWGTVQKYPVFCTKWAM